MGSTKFQFGDKVLIKETCKRGCCIEEKYVGFVAGFESNGNMQVREQNEGPLHRWVSPFDATLISNPTSTESP